MRKQQDSSVHASALQVALALALGSILVTLVASTFAQRSGGSTRPQQISAYTLQSANTEAPSAVLAGPVTVTATGGNHGPTIYPNLIAAFAAINAGTHQGDITIAIVGDSTQSSASAILNASGSGSASYTSVLIQPSGGATRTISGATSAGSPLIDLNGADNVTIDGLGTGGNALTFSNTTVANNRGTGTIRFINGAQNNIVTRCTVLGSANPASGSIAGNIIFGDTGVGSGNNSNNTISSCDLGPAGGNLPTKAIVGFGISGSPNTNNLIDNNNIFDFFSPTLPATGISILANNSNWTISNNRLYQTAPRTFTASGLRYAGVTIDSSGGFFTITGNIIGFGTANGTGTTTISGSGNEVRGLDLANVSITTPTSVQGNIISGINQTSARNLTNTPDSAFTGIALAAPPTPAALGVGRFNVGDVNGNAIGSLDGSSTIVIAASSAVANTAPIIGILDSSSNSNTISKNDIGSITINSGGTGTTTGFRAIYANGTDATQLETIDDNTIANITDNILGNYAMYGISTSSSAVDAEGNLVRNMIGNSTSTASAVTGIAVNAPVATHATLVSQNTVHSLSNTATGSSNASISGMDFTLPSVDGNLIEQNFVHSLSVSTTLVPAYQIFGIVMEGQGNATFQNNMVQLGLDAAGNSITTGYTIAGIRDTDGATANYYFNSVYVGGTGVISVGDTFAFFSNSENSTRNFENNIFHNARSNAAGTGTNVAIEVGGSFANPPGLTSDYNDPRHMPTLRQRPIPPSRPTPETNSAGSAKILTQPRPIASPAGARKK
ncbi:MAG TPA: hypothetical protein VFQ83_11870 [Candidatus Udaeobacter sp.]|nr:hypothetical protein [Candidatus Udaeobacter sp.]